MNQQDNRSNQAPQGEAYRRRIEHATGNHKSLWLQLVAVLGAGSTLGAFFGRVWSEIGWLGWPLYEWGPALILTVIVGAGLTLIWLTALRRGTFSSHSVSRIVPLYLPVLYIVQPTPNLLQAAVLFSGAVVLSLALGLKRRPFRSEWPILVLLFLLPFAVYLTTLTPAVGTRDGYELQAISATLGFAHPTGYPLFPILGRLWLALFPLGSIAWRINVLCALFAAISVPLVYATAQRVLGRRFHAGLSALLYGFAPTLWTQATQPEKYTLNALFVALVLYIAFGSTEPEQRSPHPHLHWLAFVYGLSLTHHRTMLMLAPALAVYLLWRDPGLIKRPRTWLSALGIGLLPLSIYAYIPWRAQAQGWAMTFPEFLRHISGAYYGPAVRLTDWLKLGRAAMFWRFSVGQYGLMGIALGELGLIGLGLRKQWRFLAASLLAYLSYYVWGTAWYAYYNDVNSFIPNHMLLAMWIGSGAFTIWLGWTQALKWVQGNAPAVWRTLCLATRRSSVRSVSRAFLWSTLSLVPMWMVWSNASVVDQSDEWRVTRWGEYAIAQDIAPGATILADREKHPPLDYFARIEGRRPDVDVTILDHEAVYLERLAQDLSQGKPVYLARFLPGLEGRYHLRSLGPLVEVSTESLSQVPSLQDVEAEWIEESVARSEDGWVRLLGYRLEGRASIHPLEPWHITLFWQARSQVTANYEVNLRLTSSSGQVWWKSSAHPVNGMYPTGAWKTGEIVPDWHEILLARTVPPGRYVLEVGWFRPFSSQGPTLPNREQWQSLTTISVLPLKDRPADIARPVWAVAPGHLQLLGYDLPARSSPGGRISLTLYWRVLGELPDCEIGVRLANATQQGQWSWSVPGRGEYPTTEWPIQGYVVTSHALAVPSEYGQATVQIALRVRDTGDRIAFVPGWLAPETMVLMLHSVRAIDRSATVPATANFDDRISLVQSELEPRTLAPSAPITLNIRWQCVQTMTEDYTLFVHLLAPDGTVKGQIDVWPRDGTYPTSQWAEGELIDDRYVIYLDANAPAGDYQVEIGWYLLETMQRLPVLNVEGTPIDDKVLLSGIQVSQ